MRLKEIATIQSGYISRGKIEPLENGSHLLLQARDVDAHALTYKIDNLIRFNPAMSPKDWVLRKGDILFMARGARNFSVLLKDIPDSVLAAACFFIIRVSSEKILPAYLFWYLNQEPAGHYIQRHSGRGVHMPVVRRSTLEGIDVPCPPLEIQEKIAEMDRLMSKEQELYKKLAEKRRKMITGACLKTVQNNE